MSSARSETATSSCPCGSGRDYDDCCGRYHAGAVAPDAEVLMRSRYCAYVRGNADYLLATWHPTTKPAPLSLGGEPPVRCQEALAGVAEPTDGAGQPFRIAFAGPEQDPAFFLVDRHEIDLQVGPIPVAAD